MTKNYDCFHLFTNELLKVLSCFLVNFVSLSCFLFNIAACYQPLLNKISLKQLIVSCFLCYQTWPYWAFQYSILGLLVYLEYLHTVKAISYLA